MPKFNMYQSLHTTVIGPQGKPVEMQIRTYAMHRTAEYGIAAHWKYKEKARAAARPARRVGAARSAHRRHDLAAPAAGLAARGAGPGEFLDTLRYDLGPQEVYVFTPKGDVIALPDGVDAGRLRLRGAHRGRAPLHRRPGQRQAGAAGQQAVQRRRRRDLHLEVADGRPHRRTGCGFVELPRARTKIRQCFNKERREDAIEAGKDALTKAMRKAGPAAAAAARRRLAERRSPATCTTPTSRRCTPRWGRTRSRPLGGREAGHRRSAAPRARSRTSPRPRSRPGAPSPRRSAGGDPGVVVHGDDRRLGQAGQVLHAGAGRRRSSASSPAAAA